VRAPRGFLLFTIVVVLGVAAAVLMHDGDSEGPKLDNQQAARLLASGTDLNVRCIPAQYVREGIRWGDYTCMYYDRSGRLVPQSAIGVKVDDSDIVDRTG
jgi:hypothetical protein